jgi:hypothetical protein
MHFVLRCSILSRWSLLHRGLVPTPLRRELFGLCWTPAAWLVGNRLMVVRENLVYDRPGRLYSVPSGEVNENPTGPYNEHPIKGMYRAKEK